MSFLTAFDRDSFEVARDTEGYHPGNDNPLTPHMQRRWESIQKRKNRFESLSRMVARHAQDIGIITAVVVFVVGVYAIAKSLFFLGEKWSMTTGFMSALLLVLLVLSVIGGGITWGFLCVEIGFRVTSRVDKWSQEAKERHRNRENAWWQSMDKQLRLNGVAGVYRRMCVFGPTVMTDDRELMRLEYRDDELWLVKGWSTRVTI